MNRSNYSEDWDLCDQESQWALIRWRGAVSSAIRGKRGQRFLIELVEALDAMPRRELIRGKLQADGCHCALGAVAAARGLDISAIEFPDDPDDIAGVHSARVAEALDIADALGREIMFYNDDFYSDGEHVTADQKRWRVVRAWALGEIRDRDTKRRLAVIPPLPPWREIVTDPEGE